MKKLTLIFGVIFLGLILQSSSCTEQAMKSATNDGQKSLVSNETKIPVVFTHFLNNGSSSPITLEGKIDFTNAGIGDIFPISTMTFNTSLKFDIPVNIAPIKVICNLPISVPIAINVPLGAVLLVTLIILVIMFTYIIIVWQWRKK